jgi:integrase
VAHGEFFSAFRAAVTGVGLDPTTVTFHSLRHYLASVLISQGRSIKDVQKALRHAKASITVDLYAKWFPDSGVQAADALDEEWSRGGTELPNSTEAR